MNFNPSTGRLSATVRGRFSAEVVATHVYHMHLSGRTCRKGQKLSARMISMPRDVAKAVTRIDITSVDFSAAIKSECRTPLYRRDPARPWKLYDPRIGKDY